MSAFHVYQVMRDHNRHTCICVSVERKYTYYIPMEADIVKVHQMENAEFARTFEVIPEYPVRRAAEIYLAAPDKEVSPKAREHLEAVLADPAYAYDRSLFKDPHVLKEKLMATNAAKAAAKVAGTKKPKKGMDPATAAAADAAVAAQGPINVKASKAAAKEFTHKRATDAAPAKGGRASTIDPDTRLKVGNTDSVKRGFMLDFVEKAKELEKASRGKGFTAQSIIDALTTDEHAASWVKTYVTYSLNPKYGILVAA